MTAVISQVEHWGKVSLMTAVEAVNRGVEYLLNVQAQLVLMTLADLQTPSDRNRCYFAVAFPTKRFSGCKSWHALQVASRLPYA